MSLPLEARQVTLSGFIFDKSSNETLPYANVIVEGTTHGTYSDGDGYYSIELQPGPVKLRFRFIAYKDTVIQMEISENGEMQKDVYLSPKLMSMDLTVSANRVARKVRQLARLRDQRNSNLLNYQARVYKLAILSRIRKETRQPFAFSERTSELIYTAEPERYTETLLANRSSANFFSEYDFFSTGGAPLNLNADEVKLSILAESITVKGPISRDAGNYYELYDEEADSSWPAGTIEVYFHPIKNDRPLFEGKVWYEPVHSVILGVDVTLNEFAETNSGLFSISDFRYQQSYAKVGDFWLPETTKLSAELSFVASTEPIQYTDEWSWKDFEINLDDLEPSQEGLNTTQMQPDAHLKSDDYWDHIEASTQNSNQPLLQVAKTYVNDNPMLNAGMQAMSAFHRLPYQLERSYFTNFSDLYHYNRVEGHYAGMGIRSPVHPDHRYTLIGGYGFGNQRYSYRAGFHQYLFKSFLAPEAAIYKQTLAQYQDYEYNRTPLDFFNTRQTFDALLTGSSGNNYFEKQGYEAGFRLRFAIESFIRLLYMDETHNRLESTSRVNLLDSKLLPEDFRNNDLIYPAEEGAVKGLYFHLHHDTRQYSRNQFLRNYNIREFGWLADAVWERGLKSWDSDFSYHRVRLGLKFYWPVFASHFLQADIIMAAANGEVPNQRLFSYNGYVVDDYVRYRPFNTLSYRQPLGSRVSQFRLRYKFGSSITRRIPVPFIQKSGIQLSTLMTVGVIDQDRSLEPLLPYSGSETQAEIGVAASKILGIFYLEFSKRLHGAYGNEVGFKFLF